MFILKEYDNFLQAVQQKQRTEKITDEHRDEVIVKTPLLVSENRPNEDVPGGIEDCRGKGEQQELTTIDRRDALADPRQKTSARPSS